MYFKPDIYTEVTFHYTPVKWPIDLCSCKYPQHTHLSEMQFS